MSTSDDDCSSDENVTLKGWSFFYRDPVQSTGELASLTLLNSVNFQIGTDELASLTLFNSVKFRWHLRRFLILYGL